MVSLKKAGYRTLICEGVVVRGVGWLAINCRVWMRIFWWFDQPAWVCPQMMMALGLLVSMMFLMFAYRNLGKMVINPFDLLVCWIYPPPPRRPLKLKVLPDSLQKMYIKKSWWWRLQPGGEWTQLICFQRWASFTRHHWVLIKGMPSWTWPRSNSPGCGLG